MYIEVQKIPFFFVNAYIVRGEKTLLFDSGAVVEPDALPDALAMNGIDPTEIDYIALSHAHWDHIALAAKWKELSGAKVICHKNAVDFLKTGKKENPFVFGPEATEGFIDFMVSTCMPEIPPCEPDIVIGDEDYDLHELGIPGKLIYTPGHADSGISLILDDRTALTGDLVVDLHTIQCLTSIYPPKSFSLNWINHDKEALKKSVRRVLDEADVILGGHGSPMPRNFIEPLVYKIVPI